MRRAASRPQASPSPLLTHALVVPRDNYYSQELYLAFNDITILSPLTEAEELQVLDLEANLVSDTNQVEWLQFLQALQELLRNCCQLVVRVRVLPHLLHQVDDY